MGARLHACARFFVTDLFAKMLPKNHLERIKARPSLNDRSTKNRPIADKLKARMKRNPLKEEAED